MNTKTIDITPTWADILPTYLAVIKDGNAQGHKVAREELQRMAQAADKLNALVKKAEAHDKAMDDAERPPEGEDYNTIMDLIRGV